MKISVKLPNVNKLVAAKKAALHQAKLTEIVAKLKAATPVDTGKARDGWHVDGSRIVNDVPYVSELNSGSSQQAPSLFIERTVLNVEGVIPKGIIVEHT